MNLNRFTKYCIVIFFSVASSLAAFWSITRESQDDQGLLWLIESPQGKQSILFGTLHLVDPEFDSIFHELRTYIDNARIVLIEYIPSGEYPRLFEKETTKFLLTENDYTALLRLSQNLDIPIEYIENGTPYQVFSLLINPKILKQPHIDHQIMTYAQELSITLNGLESEEDGLKIINNFSSSLFIDLIQIAVNNPESISNYTSKIKELYLDEDLDGLLKTISFPYANKEEIENFINQIVTHRNETMIKRALVELEKGGAFIAIGAAHLPGPHGFVNQLRTAGYKITKIDLFEHKLNKFRFKV